MSSCSSNRRTREPAICSRPPSGVLPARSGSTRGRRGHRRDPASLLGGHEAQRRTITMPWSRGKPGVPRSAAYSFEGPSRTRAAREAVELKVAAHSPSTVYGADRSRRAWRVSADGRRLAQSERVGEATQWVARCIRTHATTRRAQAKTGCGARASWSPRDARIGAYRAARGARPLTTVTARRRGAMRAVRPCRRAG